MSIVDRCWRLIVSASTTTQGTQGKAFYMSQDSYNEVRRIRRLPVVAHGVTRPMFGVAVELDNSMLPGAVQLRRYRGNVRQDQGGTWR